MNGNSRARFWKVFGGAWVLLSLLAAAWSIATPIGAAPDEPAHLIKAASVVRGQFVGQQGPEGQVVQVPSYIAFSKAQTCFAFKPNVSADCAQQVHGDPNALVNAPTTAGLYNPTYYLIVGWPSLLVPDSTGIYAMRLVSAVATSLLLAFSFALIAMWRRPTIPLIGLLVALTPMVFFLNGSVNPNAMEIAATLTAFVGVLTMLREPDPSRIASRSAIIFVASALAANMRGLSLLWLAVAILAPFVLVGWNRIVDLLKARSVQFAVGGIALAVLAAAAWLLSTNSLGTAVDAPGQATSAPGTGSSPISGFIWNLFSTFQYAEGIIGVFGWLDTPAPLFVFFVWSVLAGSLLLGGLIVLRERALWLVAILAGALLLLPPILQGIYITNGGIIWQGRYILPLFVCAVVAAAAGLSDRIQLSRPTMTRLATVVVGLWGIAQFQSFATALRRYAVGLDAGWLELLHPQWSPPGGVLISLSIFALLLAIPAASVLFCWRRQQAENASVATRPNVRIRR